MLETISKWIIIKDWNMAGTGSLHACNEELNLYNEDYQVVVTSICSVAKVCLPQPLKKWEEFIDG